MKKDIKKTINKLLTASIVLSVLFVIGIPGIIISAENLESSKFAAFTLALSIASVAAGFYVAPILWIQFGEYKKKQNIIISVEADAIRDISALASLYGMKAGTMKNLILTLIQKRYITDYLLNEDGTKIVPNNLKQEIIEEKLRKNLKRVHRCAFCGANVVYEGLQTTCPYCGNLLGETPKD
ncbi:MAG: hypothetical protein GX891_02420 [Clostridiales bacterium]|nr:hypothetical protein [Clostridiales bacterium]